MSDRVLSSVRDDSGIHLGVGTSLTNDGGRVVRNTLALLASQPISWCFTLGFMVIVPRNVGPSEWGEWAVAWAIGLVGRAALDLGVNTVLLKEIARNAQVARRYLGAVLALRLLLAPVLAIAIVGFGQLAGYPAHTRVVLAIVACTLAISYVGTPLAYSLQAFERMHVTALANVVTNGLMTVGALVLLKLFAVGIITIAVFALVANVAGLALEWWWLKRDVPVRPMFDPRVIAEIVRQGIPYFAAAVFFTFYVWVGGVLLSLFGSSREVGWYGASAQLISTLGVLPYAVSTAVLPALARALHQNASESEELASRSFRFVTALALPTSAGLVAIAGTLIPTVYGQWFAPASGVLTILALTLLPVYIATVVNGFIVAADRQVQWTFVMGAMCVVNPLLNLVAIPYFHHRIGNGGIGAALVLLLTDTATGVAALALLPAALRRSLAVAARTFVRSGLATIVMLLAVWPLRSSFVAIPVVIGIAVYVAAAAAVGVFSRDEVASAVAAVRPILLRRLGGATPMTEADTAA